MKSAPPVKVGIKLKSPVELVYDRSLWFVGEGAPPSAASIGAKNGDCYLDSLTGDVYRLED